MANKYFFFFSIVCILFISCNQKELNSDQPTSEFAIAIHGGAGAMKKGTYTPEQEAAYREKLREAVQLGYDMLARGDSAADVVVAVIQILEDSPLFNAGKGSVMTSDGEIRMDASIMKGNTLDAGAVTNVRRIKNPIAAAKAIMEESKYIFISGDGAENFARNAGLEMMEPAYFYTPHQIDRWMREKDSAVTNSYVDSLRKTMDETISLNAIDKNFGTVGCVVLDKHGNIAAGTSTGGLMNKKYNRIGDSPVIGAGTYANNKTCGISCTGTGEDFIKTVAAKTVSDLMEFKGMTLDEATYEMIHVRFLDIKGDGGMIAVDKNGNISFRFNSDGMFRAKANAGGNIEVYIYEK